MAQALGQLTAETGAPADTDINHLSLDGKTLRGSKDADGKAEHVLSTFCVALDQSVGPVSSRGKGREIPDALRLIDQLDLTGKIVTGDAIFCQKTIPSKVVGKGGDDVLPLKGNRKDLRDEIETAFTEPVFPSPSGMSRRNPATGGLTGATFVEALGEEMRKSGPTIRFIARLERRRDHVRRGRVTRTERETIYLITSRPMATPKRIMSVNRSHWRIKAMHRDKGVTLGEDRYPNRLDHGPAKHLHADKRHTYCAQAHQQLAHKGYRDVPDQANNGGPLPDQRPQQFLLNHPDNTLGSVDNHRAALSLAQRCQLAA